MTFGALRGLSEYDVMKLAGHSNFSTTHRFYLAMADDLVDRARQATTQQVSQELLQKCPRDSNPSMKPGFASINFKKYYFHSTPYPTVS
jgi:hypothetical protein